MADTDVSAGTGALLRTRRWLLVAVGLLVWWIVGQFDKTNISLVITDPTFLKELNLVGRNAEIGSLMSFFFFGYGFSIFVWGFLVDRIGPRRCLIFGTIAWGLMMMLMSRATSLTELLAARFALGVAEGNMWPVSNALTNRWFPAHEHSRAQAFWLTGASIGTAVGVPIVSMLMLANGWRGMMIVLGSISLVPVLLFSFIANRPREQKGLSAAELQTIEADPKAVTQLTRRVSFKELLQTTSFWLITASMVIGMATIYSLIQWIPSFLVSHHHLPFKEMSLWLTIGYLLSTVVSWGVGYIADHTMQRALTAAATCAAFVLLIPAAMMLPPVPSAVLLGTLIAVPIVISALNGAVLHTLVKPEAIARGTGIYSGVGSILSALGPLIFGALITRFHGEYWGGFLFLALLNVAGAICWFALHRISIRRVAQTVSLSGDSIAPAENY